jgi:hypothetical protein
MPFIMFGPREFGNPRSRDGTRDCQVWLPGLYKVKGERLKGNGTDGMDGTEEYTDDGDSRIWGFLRAAVSPAHPEGGELNHLF